MDEDRRDSQAAVEASFAAEPPPARSSADAPTDGGRSPPTRPVPVDRNRPPPPPAPAPASATVPVPRRRPRADSLRPSSSWTTRTTCGGCWPPLRGGGLPGGRGRGPRGGGQDGGRLGKEGVPFILVTDLGMPTSGGSSFHGRLRGREAAVEDEPHPPVLHDDGEPEPGPAACAPGRWRSASFVFKPGLSKLEPEAVRGRPRDLRPEAGGRRPAPPGGGASSRRGRRRRHGRRPPPGRARPRARAPTPRAVAPVRDPAAPPRASCGGPPTPSEISLLVMKVAREFFERARPVPGQERGAHAAWAASDRPHGAAPQPARPGDRRSPLAEPSVFRDVVAAAQSHSSGPCPRAAGRQYLMGKVGRFQSRRGGPAAAGHPPRDHRRALRRQPGDGPRPRRASTPSRSSSTRPGWPSRTPSCSERSRPRRAGHSSTAPGPGLQLGGRRARRDVEPEDPLKKGQEFFQIVHQGQGVHRRAPEGERAAALQDREPRGRGRPGRPERRPRARAPGAGAGAGGAPGRARGPLPQGRGGEQGVRRPLHRDRGAEQQPGQPLRGLLPAPLHPRLQGGRAHRPGDRHQPDRRRGLPPLHGEREDRAARAGELRGPGGPGASGPHGRGPHRQGGPDRRELLRGARWRAASPRPSTSRSP